MKGSSQGPPLPPRVPRKGPAWVRQGCLSPTLLRHSARGRCVLRSCCKRIQRTGPYPSNFPPRVNRGAGRGEFPPQLDQGTRDQRRGSRPRLGSRCSIAWPWVLGLRMRWSELCAEGLEIIRVRPQFESATLQILTLERDLKSPPPNFPGSLKFSWGSKIEDNFCRGTT